MYVIKFIDFAFLNYVTIKHIHVYTYHFTYFAYKNAIINENEWCQF